MRILLIADTSWVANQVQAAVTSPDHTVLVEPDPRQAVTRVADELPDVCVIDMQVASMGGMALTRELKDAAYSGEIPATPVLLLLDRSADRFIAGRSGAEASVLKPFHAFDLRQALTEATTRHVQEDVV